MSDATETTDTAPAEDAAADLEAANDVYQKFRAVVDDLDDDLAAFRRDHPVFAERFQVYDENPDGEPVIQSHVLREVRRSKERRVSSEWEFAAAYGYKEGIADVITALDGSMSLNFEEDGDDA